MPTEIWLHGFPIPHRTVALAVQAERWGFDELLLTDSESLVGDPYVELALAAQATERLRLGPAVTNPLTRHPAVTASAIATLQVESEGRAVLVFGRGDSAVLQLGLRPARTSSWRGGCKLAWLGLQRCIRLRSRLRLLRRGCGRSLLGYVHAEHVNF